MPTLLILTRRSAWKVLLARKTVPFSIVLTETISQVGGFSGYTSLLLRSVSTMIGYLTEQESGTMEEQNMRAEVIETMSALQNTVEALSTVSKFLILNTIFFLWFQGLRDVY